MAKNQYSDEFKADAVKLYESRAGLSYSAAAADLGISRGSLKTWVHQARKAAGKVPTQTPGPIGHGLETPEDELARLRVENESLRAEKKALRAQNDKLSEERSILQKATKYFSEQRRPGDPLSVR